MSSSGSSGAGGGVEQGMLDVINERRFEKSPTVNLVI